MTWVLLSPQNRVSMIDQGARSSTDRCPTPVAWTLGPRSRTLCPSPASFGRSRAEWIRTAAGRGATDERRKQTFHLRGGRIGSCCRIARHHEFFWRRQDRRASPAEEHEVTVVEVKLAVPAHQIFTIDDVIEKQVNSE